MIIHAAASLLCDATTACLLPSIGSSLAGDAAGAAAGTVANGVLTAFVAALTNGAAWMVQQIVQVADQTTDPILVRGWFWTREEAMIGLVQLAVIPMLMAATIGAVLRQDLRRLARIWAVGLPVAALAGVASAQLAAWALTVTDSMCSVIGDGKTQLVDQLGKSLPHTLGRAPDFVQMIILLLLIAGTLLVWLELLLRASAVYIAMSFMPLALACYIWPAAAGIAKRTVELVLALILSKFVIVAGLILGLADLTSPGPVDNVLSAGAILMIAGFAPFCLLRLAPIVETAAIAHMEGLSRRPFRAATRTVSAGVGLATNPVGRAVLAGVTSRGGPSQPSAVAPEPLPERPAAFVTSGAGGHGAQ